MILAKTANESAFFFVVYLRLKFWILIFNAPDFLQKTFAPHGFLFNNVYPRVYYHPSKLVGLVAKHPVYMYTYIYILFFLSIIRFFITSFSIKLIFISLMSVIFQDVTLLKGPITLSELFSFSFNHRKL